MRVAVYTIALNEAQFVEAWATSAQDADLLLIADTGSTDNTVELAEMRGVEVVHIGITPWRFDMARNAALAAVPLDIDYCIALDMDEVLLPGWREALEDAHKRGITRPRYKYTWNWNPDGSPGLIYGGDKIHARKGYRWRNPVHEVLTPYFNTQEVIEWTNIEIHHHPDDSKPRSQYLPLLAFSVAEDPHDDRNAHYYARDLFGYGHVDLAITEFKRHLALPSAVWAPERAESMRYLAKLIPDEAEHWLQSAIQTSPGRREPWVDLAKFYYEKSQWQQCLDAATEALKITVEPLDYLNQADAWGHAPYDWAAIAAFNLGFYDRAFEYGKAAAANDVTDERLAQNLAFYSAAISARDL